MHKDLKMLRSLLFALAASAAALSSNAAPDPAAGNDPLLRPATIAARAGAAVLLDATTAGHRLVAVGEHGIVLLSDDGGASWRQASLSPTSVTLTAVRFTSPTRGWATGHAGLIMTTDDGGEHWRKQLDGVAFAQASLTAAQAALAAAADKTAATLVVTDAQRLVADGADKPFFDLWFADARHGFAVGAYDLFVRTDDGGVTWKPAPGLLPNPKGNHLHAIRGQGGLIFIAGEQGLLLRSTDGGQSFQALKSPYVGSFFTLELPRPGEVVVAGLRGNAFRSTDQGENWQPIAGLPPVTWIASALAPDGTLLLGNQAGAVFASRDSGVQWASVPPQPGSPGAPLTAMLPVGPGQLLTTTFRGIGHLAYGPAALTAR